MYVLHRKTSSTINYHKLKTKEETTNNWRVLLQRIYSWNVKQVPGQTVKQSDHTKRNNFDPGLPSIKRSTKPFRVITTCHDSQLTIEMIFSSIKLRFYLFVFLTTAVFNTKAQINVFSPLLKPVTSFEIETLTSTIIQPTVCFITSGDVSTCRRRRGVLEEPDVINPSTIIE